MAHVLVTGGTGLIGAQLVRELAKRGDDVRVAARRAQAPDALREVAVEFVSCDVLDRRAVRRALKGVDRVFHCAGLTSLRAVDRARCFEVNVGGTKTVLEEALRSGVERVVYVSSAAAVGPAPPNGVADETQLFTAGRLRIAYVNSKHEAEAEAMRLAAHGLPLVCVNPTFVLGPGDERGSSSAAVVRRYMLRRIPVYVAGGFNVVDVRDVAKGLVAADRRGKPGERYLLAGRNYTWDRFFADVGRISGIDAPLVRVPGAAAAALAEAASAAPVRLPLEADELRAAAQWWTYRAAKAERELRFSARPHEETIEATVDWWLERDGERIAAAQNGGAGRRALDAALGATAGALRLAGRARRTVLT